MPILPYRSPEVRTTRSSLMALKVESASRRRATLTLRSVGVTTTAVTTAVVVAEAVPLPGASGTRSRPPSRRPRPRGDGPAGRALRAGPSHATRAGSRPHRGTQDQRVRNGGDLLPASRPGPDPRAAPQPRVGLRLRPRIQRDRRLRQVPAEEARRAEHLDGSGRRVPPRRCPRRGRSRGRPEGTRAPGRGRGAHRPDRVARPGDGRARRRGRSGRGRGALPFGNRVLRPRDPGRGTSRHIGVWRCSEASARNTQACRWSC
ncbi:hypothetical protein BH20ACT24_BH20ACT24_01690 [soil metagenome]